MLNFKGFEILPFAEVQVIDQHLIIEAGWIAVLDKEEDSDLLASHRFQLFNISQGADEIPKKQFSELFTLCLAEVQEFNDSAFYNLSDTEIKDLTHEIVSVVAKKLTGLRELLSTKFPW